MLIPIKLSKFQVSIWIQNTEIKTTSTSAAVYADALLRSVRYLHTFLRSPRASSPLLQDKQSQLSQRLQMTDAPSPSLFSWPFARPAPVWACPCPTNPRSGASYGPTTEPAGYSSSPVLSRGDHLPCPVGNASPNTDQESQGHTAGLCSIFCPPGHPGPFLKSCFPESQPLVCTDAWGQSLPCAGLHTSLSWISLGSCCPISPACQGPSEWQHNHLVYQPLFPVLHILQTYSRCTPSIIQVTNDHVKQYWISVPLGMPLVIGFMPLTTTVWVQKVNHFDLNQHSWGRAQWGHFMA